MEQRDSGAPFQDVMDDHRGLLERLAAIEAESEPERIHEEIRLLIPVLEMHFEREERPGGMFTRVETQDPRQSGEIRALRDEHVALIDTAVSLIERAALTSQQRLPSHDLVSDVHKFTTHLRRHEARENALLTDAHYHEEGGGD
ncbi:MAG: hemerythrin domain-containing protein [Candidatus Eisenbacteria bacterium]|uniref:Hemerythrin domain-containing protein n=1 Tax=Eiseniibacteriota bacterium TaxID=2212470 RepID=A0A956NAF7_UNCEI|nr:hemerythrin domain-containing protein [Candidatus Eisenbacteria bacterium]MCB9462258.1 hemerythrin domain-containing protein [Candidatus Eisenbacteria bacterium]